MSDSNPWDQTFFDDPLLPSVENETGWEALFSIQPETPGLLFPSEDIWSYSLSEGLDSIFQNEQIVAPSPITVQATAAEILHHATDSPAVQANPLAPDLRPSALATPPQSYLTSTRALLTDGIESMGSITAHSDEKLQPTKRVFDDFILTFSTNEDAALEPRKRQAFTSERHLLREGQSKDVIRSLPKWNQPTPQTVYIRFCPHSSREDLRLEVHNYSETMNDVEEMVTFTGSSTSLNGARFSKISTPKYAILHHSLPSVTKLEEWVQRQGNHLMPIPSPAERLFTSFRILLDTYCNIKPDLPSREFSKAALRITHLYECLRKLFAQKTQPQMPASYISKAALVQIALVAKQGIAESELIILSELDNFVQRSKRPSKESELPIWAGVWVLILLYRDIGRRCQQMDRSHYFPRFESTIYLAKQMVNALTSTYNLLFGNKSPSSINWETEENFRRIRRNNELRACLNTIKEHTRTFFYQSLELGDYDSTIKKLIVEEEEHLLALAPPMPLRSDLESDSSLPECDCDEDPGMGL
ncbi:hypothetical protein G7Y89_g12503 [Cudoniella acicularis]|uniref:Uncharacterized protein n=1 Tax=Cudoniella acicularis TaxID=354080 RepID=A0A8H4VWY6_9HELO|nr:hypothetical protein G7Y89_g12503 [Cudoniella acicularis]